MFERVGEDTDAPESVAETAYRLSRGINVQDILLPASTDTIEFKGPDEDGNLVTYEALPPGGQIIIELTSK